MRLIDADSLKEQMLAETQEHEKGVVDIFLEAVAAMIDEQPTIERKTGKWIEIIDADEFGEPYPCGVQCSECGFCSVSLDNFCPDCGADMRGVE